MLHPFTDSIVAFKLVGIEFGVFGFHETLDKLKNCLSSDIQNELSDDLSTTLNCTNNGIFDSSTTTLTGFAFLFIVVLSAFSTDIGFVSLNDSLKYHIFLCHLGTDTRHHTPCCFLFQA